MDYVKLKAAISEAEKKCGLAELDHTTRDLLHAVAYANATNRRINVSKLVRRDHYGTLPTVLTRVKKLEQAGFIVRIDDPDDQRSFQLRSTAKAQSAFHVMSKMISAAYKS